MAKTFRDLVVWQRAIDLTTSTYRVTSAFPKTEIYGLSAQMRRAAVSIASNIAEGAGRSTKRDFNQFIAMAKGSNYELQTQIEIAQRLGFAPQTELGALEVASIEIGKMLNGLSSFLTRTQSVSPATMPTMEVPRHHRITKTNN